MAKEIDILTAIQANTDAIAALAKAITLMVQAPQQTAAGLLPKLARSPRMIEKAKRRHTFEVLLPWAPSPYGPHYAPGEIVGFIPTPGISAAVARGALKARPDLKAEADKRLDALLKEAQG